MHQTVVISTVFGKIRGKVGHICMTLGWLGTDTDARQEKIRNRELW